MFWVFRCLDNALKSHLMLLMVTWTQCTLHSFRQKNKNCVHSVCPKWVVRRLLQAPLGRDFKSQYTGKEQMRTWGTWRKPKESVKQRENECESLLGIRLGHVFKENLIKLCPSLECRSSHLQVFELRGSFKRPVLGGAHDEILQNGSAGGRSLGTSGKSGAQPPLLTPV